MWHRSLCGLLIGVHCVTKMWRLVSLELQESKDGKHIFLLRDVLIMIEHLEFCIYFKAFFNGMFDYNAIEFKVKTQNCV